MWKVLLSVYLVGMLAIALSGCFQTPTQAITTAKTLVVPTVLPVKASEIRAPNGDFKDYIYTYRVYDDTGHPYLCFGSPYSRQSWSCVIDQWTPGDPTQNVRRQ